MSLFFDAINLDTINYLVYSGGNSNGWVFSGMDECIDMAFRRRHINLRSQLKGVAANSIGSFFALARVCGYTAREFRGFASRELSGIDIKIDLTEMWRTMGVSSADHVTGTAAKMLEQKLGEGSSKLTMLQLFEETGIKMTLAAYNISRCRMEYMDHENHPNLSVVLAIRMTTSMPIIFAPVEYNDCLYVDGGIGENIPTIFPVENTLVMYIITYHGYTKPKDIKIADYLCRITHPTMQNEIDYKLSRVSADMQNRFIGVRIPCSFASTSTDVKLSPEKRQHLINEGYMRMFQTLYPKMTQVIGIIANLVLI